ncbi:unnamed protein product, partial [Iphiclides podalirius]
MVSAAPYERFIWLTSHAVGSHGFGSAASGPNAPRSPASLSSSFHASAMFRAGKCGQLTPNLSGPSGPRRGSLGPDLGRLRGDRFVQALSNSEKMPILGGQCGCRTEGRRVPRGAIPRRGGEGVEGVGGAHGLIAAPPCHWLIVSNTYGGSRADVRP